SVTEPDTVCIGDMLQLEATGGQNYRWTGPDNFVSLSQTPVIEKLQASDAGSYSVEISNADGCKSVYAIFVSAKLPDTLQVDDFDSICRESAPLILDSSIESHTGIWKGEGVTHEQSRYYFTPENLQGNIQLTFIPDSSFHCVTATPAHAIIPELS